MGFMRILVINPVGTSRWDESDRKVFEGYASPETVVDVVSLESGPESLETRAAEAQAVPLVVEKALKTYMGYNAIIVNCFLDPGVEVLRSILDIPVVGPCESSLAIASVLGWSLGVVTVMESGRSLVMERIRKLGFSHRVSSVRYVSIPVLELNRDLGRTISSIVEEGRKARDFDGVEVLILGCTGMAGLAKQVEDMLNIPVIDPAGAALKIAESLVRLQLTHSRRY